jgi:hypothetical protein
MTRLAALGAGARRRRLTRLAALDAALDGDG